jgi:hypothetical protein
MLPVSALSAPVTGEHKMIRYELRLTDAEAAVVKVYRLTCPDDAAAMRQVSTYGDLRFRRVELWRDGRLVYRGSRCSAPLGAAQAC